MTTTTTNPFRIDNTEGYTEAELAALNREWERQGGHLIEDKSERDHLAEVILRDFDKGVVEAQAVVELCTLCTRDGAGRHFTEWSRHWARLEAAGAITINRPEHPATGLPYGQEEWTLRVTDLGQQIVDDHPELHPEI